MTTIVNQSMEQKEAASKRLSDLLTKASDAGISSDVIGDLIEQVIATAGGDEITESQLADPQWVRSNRKKSAGPCVAAA